MPASGPTKSGNAPHRPPVKVAVCMPRQTYTREEKLDWLERTVDHTDCDLFCTPQEYLGGHYVMPKDLHMERDWVLEEVGRIAVKTGKHIAVGACCRGVNTGATEDYLYLDDKGNYLGHHSKYALPSYDDMRTGGHGQLWPETNYQRRIKTVDLPKLRVKAGTIFCWEIYSQMLWASYSFNRANLIVHPIKFAPRGWLKNEKKSDGFKHIVGFGNAPKSNIWPERLYFAAKHQVMCPIAVSCNSWNLGPKFMAIVGWVDEMRYRKDENNERRSSTDLHDVESNGNEEFVRVYEMVPEFYEGLDHHHSGGAFVAHTGSIDGFSEMGEHTMHGKIRRLEAQLIGGSTAMDCALKASTQSRQKKSVPKRAFGMGQKVKMPRRKDQ